MSWAARPLAITGAVAAGVASGVVIAISMSWSPRVGGSESAMNSEWSMRGIVVAVVLFGIPLLLAIVGAVLRKSRAAQVVRVLSGLVFGLLVLLFAFGGGVFYIPASLLMIAAGVLTDVHPPEVTADKSGPTPSPLPPPPTSS